MDHLSKQCGGPPLPNTMWWTTLPNTVWCTTFAKQCGGPPCQTQCGVPPLPNSVVDHLTKHTVVDHLPTHSVVDHLCTYSQCDGLPLTHTSCLVYQTYLSNFLTGRRGCFPWGKASSDGLVLGNRSLKKKKKIDSAKTDKLKR